MQAEADRRSALFATSAEPVQCKPIRLPSVPGRARAAKVHSVVQRNGGEKGKDVSKLARDIASGAVDVHDTALDLSDGQREVLDGLVAMLRSLEQIEAQLRAYEAEQEALLPTPIPLEEFLASREIDLPVGIDEIRRTYKALKDKKWMEMVRRQHHGKGATAYDHEKSLGDAGPRDGGSYSKSWKDADEYVAATLGTRLTLDGLKEIHDRLARHLQPISWRNEQSGGASDGRINVELAEEHATPAGVKEIAEDKNLDYVGHSPERAVGDGMFERGRHHIRTKRKTAAEVQAAAQKIIDDYYRLVADAATDDERLTIIADTVQRIGRLHAFEDANTRTNMLILNKFLVENGLTPSMVNDPKDYYLKSAAEWRAEIKKGMSVWKDVARVAGWSPDQPSTTVASPRATTGAAATAQRPPPTLGATAAPLDPRLAVGLRFALHNIRNSDTTEPLTILRGDAYIPDGVVCVNRGAPVVARGRDGEVICKHDTSRAWYSLDSATILAELGASRGPA